MKKINLQNIVWKENSQFVSLNLNTGVSSFGDSKKEAILSLQEALELYFEDIKVAEATKVERLDIIPSVFQYA